MTETMYQKPVPQTDWLMLQFVLPKAQEDFLTTLLFECGAEGLEVEDPTEIIDHLARKDWDVSVYEGQQPETGLLKMKTWLPCDDAGKAALAAIEEGIRPFPEIVLTWEVTPPVDWQQTWKESFTARAVGARLWVAPEWDETPAPEGRTRLAISPGMAFGTGDHATTGMVLELLDEYLQPGTEVTDLGCGSGILAIAALKLGAKHAICVDIDPVCEDVVAKHCAINGVTEEELSLTISDVLSDEKLQRMLRANKADVVVANIYANVICDLAPVVGRFMKEGAYLICSGILEQYADRVAKALVNGGFTILRERTQGEWVAFMVAASPE